MMMNNTLAQLRELKLVGMATAVEEQLSSTASTALSFEERLALMVDRKVHQRADKRHAARLKRAQRGLYALVTMALVTPRTPRSVG